MINVYFARPFSEYSPESVKAYYRNIISGIKELKLDKVIYPIVPLSVYETDPDTNTIGNQPGLIPELSDRAIVEKDFFMIRRSDIIVADLTFSGAAIGTTMEIAYAHANNKHIVLLYDKDRPVHIFYTGLAHLKYPVHKIDPDQKTTYIKPVLKYLKTLAHTS